MAITTNKLHDDHTVSIHLTKRYGTHYAALRCDDCNKHIQWLDQYQTEILSEITKLKNRKTNKDFWNEV